MPTMPFFFLCSATRPRLTSIYQSVWQDTRPQLINHLGTMMYAETHPSPYCYEMLHRHCHHRWANLGRLPKMEMGQVVTVPSKNQATARSCARAPHLWCRIRSRSSTDAFCWPRPVRDGRLALYHRFHSTCEFVWHNETRVCQHPRIALRYSSKSVEFYL